MSNLIILTNTDSMVWQRSIGAYQVASHCRLNGVSCQVIDFTEMFAESDLIDMINKFIDEDTIAVGVSTTFYRNKDKNSFIETDIKDNNPITDVLSTVLRTIKMQHPNIKLIAGGANSHIVKNNPLFNAVFHGYSEAALVSYLKDIRAKKLNIYPTINTVQNIDGITGQFEIETLSHVWDNTDCVLPNETLPIEISRGCIFKCKFCSYPLNGKKKLDYLRSPECIQAELIDNYKKFGTTNYFLSDDTFNDSTYKLEQLHKIFTNLPFKIKFVTYLRLDLIYRFPEQITLLKEMGLGSAFFGIESLNHETAKAIGKGMPSDKVKEFLVDLHDNHWEGKIPFTCSFIVGLPKESTDSVTKTWEWVSNTPFQDLWFPLRITPTAHYKSDFDINYTDYGYILDETEPFRCRWTNDMMDYDTAKELADKFNNGGAFGTKAPSSWFLFCLLSHGYSLDTFINTPNKDLPWKSFMLQKHRLFKTYKSKLLGLSNKRF